MSVRLAAVFVDTGVSANDPKEAMRALFNAFFCRDLTTQERNEIVELGHAIGKRHPDISREYGDELNAMSDDAFKLIRACKVRR